MGRTKRRLPGAGEFGRRARAQREALGLSQMAFAEKVGLHFTYVSSVERGERNISLENILRFAMALGVDPSELVVGLRPENASDGDPGKTPGPAVARPQGPSPIVRNVPMPE